MAVATPMKRVKGLPLSAYAARFHVVNIGNDSDDTEGA